MKNASNKKSTIFKASIIFAVMVLATIALISISVQNAFAIGASPLRMTYKAMPGETVKGQLNVKITSKEAREIVIGKAYFEVDRETENLQFFNSTEGEYPGCLKNWITLPDKPIVAEPGETTVIPYKIAVPDDASAGGYYGALFIESSPIRQTQKEEQSGVGVQISTRVAHLILLEVGDNNPEDIVLKDISISKTGDDYANIDIVMFNNEKVHNAPSGELEIFGIKEEALITIPLNKGVHHVMPERKKTFTEQLSLNELRPGIYYAVLRAKTAQGQDLKAEVRFEVTKDKQIETLEKNLNKINGVTMRQAAETQRKTINITVAVSAILMLAVCLALVTQECVCKTKKRK